MDIKGAVLREDTYMMVHFGPDSNKNYPDADKDYPDYDNTPLVGL